MRALILTNYPFPYGMAQTNRLIAISKGLIHAGVKVKVIVTKPTEPYNKVLNNIVRGSYQGVEYEYATGSTVRPKSKIKRIALFFRGIVNTRKLIRSEQEKGKIDCLFAGVMANYLTYIFYKKSKKYKIKFLQERSEYPFLSYSKGLLGRLRLWIYLNLVCKLFDGFVVISKALDNYFKPYLMKGTKTFLLPILVETERFKKDYGQVENTISYCGSMQGNKDGVPILIEAFSKIASKYPELKIKLIGNTNFEGFEQLKNKVRELGLSKRAIFTGRVERDDMPELLSKSRILALARPYSKQAEGGFPTKLGEYLASGRLVVVTAVGEIPDYLKHMETAFLAEPGNPESFANMLDMALENEELSERIAKNGKQLAEQVFNYKTQGELFYNWLKSI